MAALSILVLVLLFGGAAGDDVAALLEFKKGIADRSQDPVLGSWSTPATTEAGNGGAGCPSGWRGVVCDGGAVVSVALDGLGLAGELKLVTLAGMRALQNLSLAGNAFSGRLPPAIGYLSSLHHLDLSANRFYGPIPGRLADLAGLVHLNLSHNNFSSGFPTDGIRQLQNLRRIDIRNNSFWGNAGDLLTELRNAEYIDLSGNLFTGSVDLELESLTSIGNTVKYLNLSHNKLDGGFFRNETVGAFKNLAVLDLSNNGIGGTVPRLDAWFSLEIFRVAGNGLFGMIPEALLQNLMRLVEVDLSRNGFSGSVPTVNSTTLKVLNLSSNVLSGSLPANVGKCTSVDLSGNLFSGELAILRSWDGIVEVIDLSSNKLEGSYPNDASQFQNLISLKLRNNSLSGSLPSVLVTYQKLSVLDLSLNALGGSVLPTFFLSPTLTVLNLSGNSFTGTISFQSTHSTESILLSSQPVLKIVDLSSNSLSGPLPPDISNLQKLVFLTLAMNELSGEIPSEISKLQELEYVDLSYNHLTGRIPDMPQTGLKIFNVSYNNLQGTVPKSVEKFPLSCFRPGNDLLVFPDGLPAGNDDNTGVAQSRTSHRHKAGVRVALIVGCIGAVLLVIFISLAVYVVRSQELCGRNGFRGQITIRDLKGRLSCPNLFKSPKDNVIPSKTSFSNDHLLTSAARSMSAQKEFLAEAAVGYGYADPKEVAGSTASVQARESSPQSALPTSPHSVDSRFHEEPVTFEVYSPDRLVGELIFLDSTLVFTAEDLSRAPAQVLGRNSHGTTYKAVLQSGHVLTVKWLRVGLVKQKKEFTKEIKRIGSIRHPNIISWRTFYWGPKEQERLIISDYVNGDSLALYLYESTPRRYSQLSVCQRLKIAIDLARCLQFLHHEKGLPHGNLKPTNIFLTGPDLSPKLVDYCLHRFMTPSGTAEQILNLGALGYRPPELANATKPAPSFKADVYAFGVIVMEMLTRKSAGDIISGQSSAVDLTDWVQMCNREGRGTDCFDRDITGLEESPRIMDELLSISLRCIRPVNERPNMKTVCDDLCSITV
ncbi:probable inactive receptor kinase At5g10020 [Phragmites australis]|uniref:probable inactive receptor kinase At5g10020 n=1 Tax=Phragmites australis TaxID=29695 RepID=UPI002D780821|nr:probable inactive receptor kinase At5g10020 [Phragmites australis]